MNDQVNILQKYRIGSFDQRVQILAPTETQASNGAVTQTWGEYGTFYAQVTPVGGQENISADQIVPVSRAKFVFRYDSTITEKYRLVWNSHTYQITSIDVIPRNRFLVITAESNSLSGGVAVDYGDYYSTSSLKMRYIIGGVITAIPPTQAQFNTIVGLTAIQARNGYTFECTFTYLGVSVYYIVWSNGSNWINVKGTVTP